MTEGRGKRRAREKQKRHTTFKTQTRLKCKEKIPATHYISQLTARGQKINVQTMKVNKQYIYIFSLSASDVTTEADEVCIFSLLFLSPFSVPFAGSLFVVVARSPTHSHSLTQTLSLSSPLSPFHPSPYLSLKPVSPLSLS